MCTIACTWHIFWDLLWHRSFPPFLKLSQYVYQPPPLQRCFHDNQLVFVLHVSRVLHNPWFLYGQNTVTAKCSPLIYKTYKVLSKAKRCYWYDLDILMRDNLFISMGKGFPSESMLIAQPRLRSIHIPALPAGFPWRALEEDLNVMSLMRQQRWPD